MKKFLRILLIVVLCCGVATVTPSCRNAGKAAKEITKRVKPKKTPKLRPIGKVCSKCGHRYTGYECPYCN